MEEGKILLVGNETDILHCGYSFPLSEDGKRYPSADHYAHSMILTQLKLDEVHILELLATPSCSVSMRARELLQENMPAGHDMNSLAQYLMTSRQSYTMLGLRLRAEQDKRFKQALMETKDALLLVCDRRDSELGIGMNDVEFVAFARKHRADAERIGQWMHDERTRPREVGQNQLGFFLMWLRYEIREKERAKWTCTQEIIAKGLSTGDDDQNIDISVSDFVISLQGIFRPLSNYYAMNFEIKGDMFRSVEHYAYQRLFESLKLDYEELMKLRTTVLPVDVAKVARRVLKTLQVDEKDVEGKSSRLERWRQSAMKHKISKNEYLQKLLLSTGHAILIDNVEDGDSQWFSKTDEFELQHLLTKKYISPTTIIDYMCGGRGAAKIPYTFYHLNGNKSGMLLMELRAKFAVGCTHRIPLVSPLATNVLRTAVSPHMICFTPESILHPFYPVRVRPSPEAEPLPSAAHLVAMIAFKFFGIQKEYQEYIMETDLGPECWHRLHYILGECLMPSVEKIQQWYMEERQNAIKQALQLTFEQNQVLQRILLETEDALLVSCARFSSLEGELNIGMREQDLRLWLTHVDIDTKNLIDLCLRPMAFRPPYLGGNRLGLILMELRRDFILQGVFPKQLPASTLSIETILGTDSPTENYLPQYEFDPLDLGNYNALWANPLLLMAKQMADTNPILWQKATAVKRPPILLSTNTELIEQKLEQIKEMHKNQRNEAVLSIEEFNPPLLRSLIRDLLMLIREKTVADCDVQLQISNKSKESNRMQEIRRSAERTRDRIMNNDSSSSSIQQQQQQPQWSQPSGRPTKPISPVRYRNGNRPNPISQLDPKMPSLISEFGTPSTSQNNNNLTNSNSMPSLRDRYDHRDRRAHRGFDGGLRRPLYSAGGQRRPRSPSPNNNIASGGSFYNRRSRSNIQGGISPYRGSSSGGRSPPNDFMDNNGSKHPPSRNPSIGPPTEQPPAAKKPKRVVDESELSEGEILSDDDE